jgi:hypothetical protein
MATKKLSKKQKTLIILNSVIALLVVVRLILPYVVLHYANKSLAEMKGYYGHIEDIDLAIIRGAYKIDSIYINKLDSTTSKQTPFFGAKAIDLSVEWKALFHGSIVGELVFEEPSLRFTKEKAEPKEVRKDSAQFDKVLDDFMPLRVNRVEINRGKLQYIDEGSSPKVDIALTDAYIIALNLRNSYDSAALLPARVSARASVYEGDMTFTMKLNPLAKEPTFDMNAEVKNTNLVLLNDFFQAYAKIDVNKGVFGLYTEVAAKEGKFTGYVKPLIKDLDVLGKEDRDDNVFRKLWEGLAGTVGEIFENQKRDQVATKVPFKGDLKNPDTNLWYAVGRVLQNAFVQALQPAIDNEINIATIEKERSEKKTFIEKVFDKDEEAKADKKEARKERRRERREQREQKKKEKAG